MKKLIIGAIVSLGLLVGSIVPADAAAPYCGITWGSANKVAADTTTGEELTGIRTGRQSCYDRMVFDVNGPASGYDVRYVSNVYAEGSGQLIPLTGGAKLRVVLKTPAYNESGSPTYSATVGQKLPGINLTGYQTFRDARYAGSFEGQTTVGVGVRAQLPFRVLKLTNPHRIVVDVAHFW